MANLDEFYGDRYIKLLPKVLAEVQGELARVYEQILNGNVSEADKIAFLLENETTLKTAIAEKFTSAHTQSINGAYADAIKQNRAQAAAAGIEFVFSDDQIQAIARIKASDILHFSNRASIEAGNIFDSLVKWAFSGTAETLEPFFVAADQIGTAKHAQTIINTQVRGFFRQLNIMAGNNAGVTHYRYAGPSPGRPFCAAIIGKTFSLKEIQQLNNGQTSNTFITAGGFNCRHRWVPTNIEGKDPSDTQINKRFKDIGVQPPSKDLILVKKNDEIIGRMYRVVKGGSYQRTTGLRQKVDAVGKNFELDLTDA